MIKSQLPIQEEDALRRILRHHDAPVTRELVGALGTLINWVRADEYAKIHHLSKTAPQAPYLINLLSSLGIYGREYIDTVPTAPGKDDAQ